jgi:hypothetical protein
VVEQHISTAGLLDLGYERAAGLNALLETAVEKAPPYQRLIPAPLTQMAPGLPGFAHFAH